MQNFNAKIISEIVKRSQKKEKNPVSYLTRIFDMSKETAYRRIRNQIPFSVEEAVVIAKYFNLSLDEMLDLKCGTNSPFNRSLDIEQTPVDIYSGLLKDDIDFMENLLSAKDVKITAAINRIPFRFLPYKSLFKLEYCNYIHSAGKIQAVNTHYSDIELSPALNELHNKSVSYCSRLNNLTCIVDNVLYSNIIKKIQYYHRLRFLSNEDLKVLQSELFEMLEMYENLLRSGKNYGGSDWTFYYSFFNLESNLAYFEYDGESVLQFWIYPESPVLIRNNRQMNDIQKRWIESKIRNSMSITKTTDIYQIEMLRTVYQQISDLTKPDIKYDFF